MEEGTGIGLYILVAIIIFGLFVVIATLFGENIKGIFSTQMSEASTKVSSYTTDAFAQSYTPPTP